MKEFIKSQKLKKKIGKISENLKQIKIIYYYIENFSLTYEKHLYEEYLYGKCCWIERIKLARKNAKLTLKQNRFYFAEMLKKDKMTIFENFSEITEDIKSFENYTNISNCFDYSSYSKNVVNKLQKFIEDSKKLNYYEEVLQFDITNFKGNLNF